MKLPIRGDQPLQPAAKPTLVDGLAILLEPIGLGGAVVLYFFVTWDGEHAGRRDPICAALLVAGVGAGIRNLPGMAPGVKRIGAITMGAGLVALFVLGLW
jgi:hypothetical protein